ncbi:uncharacterized protein PHALS_05223 [Plasmopara halstedii]|uniref:Uncharacterized protein n=1 Tax=Plasmopara halstedii TaxID=4781 RepID=A0A0P1AZN1_PLAHL|nr:uncharacterized protein PHALS_05223 [Plasmopara halstedii]CEG47898.1 hypothetical protein PHALS_05223 [Plasmopara halstedii]|eukprot:XP_024584267.1 hypothetical protein PHALS_05223 [Plasmopara halstedii]
MASLRKGDNKCAILGIVTTALAQLDAKRPRGWSWRPSLYKFSKRAHIFLPHGMGMHLLQHHIVFIIREQALGECLQLLQP